jgi:hypothetical protein
MEKPRAFRIVTSDELAQGHFRGWHETMISRAHQAATGDYLLPDFGFKFALRSTELPVPDCDLSWGISATGRTVQINPAGSAGDANVLSAIAEDREAPGRFALLRQGRLQRNRETTKPVSGGEFRFAFQKMPVSTIGSFGAKGREWFLVCDFSEDTTEMLSQTADFVERCARVRAKYGPTPEQA